MVIQVDTREHKSEWGRIQSQFDSLGVQYFRSKLYCGDYQSLDNAKLCIDRKRICKSFAEMSASSMKDSKQSLSERVKQVFS